MKSIVILALLGYISGVKLGDWYDQGFEDQTFDSEKHNIMTTQFGQVDLAQHGKKVTDNSMVQTGDNFDNGFEDINISPDQIQSKYFMAQNGKMFDLANKGQQVNLRHESFINGSDELLQTGDYFDQDLPEDAFKDKETKVAKKE